ncbi:MAG TPA: response regulator transcription factor [Verrucomicrobiae bacterium]|nr:response regulator transcription factor [Verrucomicrobiae bacterium]
MAAVRVLVADDHEVVRQGIRALVERQPGWEVCGEVVTGREAVEQARRLKPDVVVMDITMPELNGLEATRQILKDAPETRILILTVHDSEDLVCEVFRAGARGYLLKSDAGRELATAIGALHEGKRFCTAKITDILLGGFLQGDGREPGPDQRRGTPTPREREIVQLLAEGKSNKEVATVLGISVATAESHRYNVMQKLHFHSLAELVHYAIRNHIVEP